MASAKRGQTSLTDDQLAELLELIKGADSVELKLTVPESSQRMTAAALRMDPLDAQIRQVFFFDTPALTLNAAGLVVRARQGQRLRGEAPPGRARRVAGRAAELAQSRRRGRRNARGVRLLRLDELAPTDVRAAVFGKKRLRSLFSKEQRAFFKAHAPEGAELDELSVLGPIFVLKLKWSPKGFTRPLVAELWLYPDGSRILELSTKCAPREAFDVAAESRAFLAAKGVDLSGEQQTKTKVALQFFAKELVGSGGAQTT